MLTPPTDWVVLSNRLLLLQELMVGLSQLRVEDVLSRAASGIGWVFDGAALRVLGPEALSPTPLVARGRVRLPDQGEVYVAYFAGPPEPRYLVLTGVALVDPQEFRLAALFCEHLVAALEAAGYREELERQARTDWLTGLPNLRSFEEVVRASRDASEAEVGALGVLECRHAASGADSDLLLKKLAGTLQAALPAGARAFRTGTFRMSVTLPSTAVGADIRALEAALARAEFGVQSGWARSTGGEAEAVVGLVARATAALETTLEAAPAHPGAFQSRASEVPTTVLPSVYSGFEALRVVYQEWARALPVPVSLVLDGPHGYAFDLLSGEAPPVRPAVVITEGASEAYLRDLSALEPEGLIVGRVGEPELQSALSRAAQGERFYQGPTLGDDGLFPREREVWRLVARGLGNAQISERLEISEKTVANYVTSLQEKLHLHNRVELVLSYLKKLEPDRGA